MSFVKLDKSLLSSSLWIQGDAETVRVWVYLLLAADPHGVVEETLPAIAMHNKLAIERAEEILRAFASADPHSRTPTAEGRRIIISREPQWLIEIVNFDVYRAKDHTSAARARRYRERKRASRRDAVTDRDQSRCVTQEEAEEEADVVVEERGTKVPPPPPPARSRRRRAIPVEPHPALPRFVAAFNGVFQRRVSVTPALVSTFGKRVDEGYSPDTLIALPILVSAQGLDREIARKLRPSWLLRNGDGHYTFNGTTRRTKAWVEDAIQSADQTTLRPSHREVAAKVGCVEALKELGVQDADA